MTIVPNPFGLKMRALILVLSSAGLSLTALNFLRSYLSYSQTNNTLGKTSIASDSLTNTLSSAISLNSDSACTLENQEQFFMQADAFVPKQNDLSTTIILNVYKGNPESFRIQLETALMQEGGPRAVPHVWVNIFNSPLFDDFNKIYQTVLENQKNGIYGRKSPFLSLTTSSFNFKFHGRFLLGFMAPTKYLLIVDDDTSFGTDAVKNLVGLMNTIHRGVWGGFGHLRGSGIPNTEYRSWPGVKINTTEYDHYEMDYLSGMWFIEQGWLEYFFKERTWTWQTGEDIHLSSVMRKYLNLNTYGGVVSRNNPNLPAKSHSATTGHYFEMREFMADHYLGRGNKIADVRPTIDTLVYIETVQNVQNLISLIQLCETARTSAEKMAWWCNLGKIAAIFRGSCHDQNVPSLIKVSKELCSLTQCESFALKSEFKHPISYFNLRQNFGHEHEHVPLQTSMADIIPSITGILQNVGPKKFIYQVETCKGININQNIDSAFWSMAAKLAFEAYRNSPSNLKFSEGFHGRSNSDQEHEKIVFPTTVGLMWHGVATSSHSLVGPTCI
ncbi:hypothetical protein HK100_012838 [Physocladia obscura]|uniref:Uncharacterized protein n=1 Tax=Physocladia obscura TaxID=109957 RepID=A0AAD5T0L3_9FUNG|nr:hypothetical protein HK100_012838 [Physocladia obscura]